MSRLLRVGTLSVPASAAAPNVTLAGGSSSYLATDPDDAYSYFRFNRDGTIDRAQGNTNTYSYFDDWCDAPSATVGDSFEIITDSAPSGAGSTADVTTSYQTMNTDFIMGHKDTGPAGLARVWSGNITIREIANTSNTDTGAYSTSADVA